MKRINPLISPDWAKKPRWQTLSQRRVDQLNRFLRYLKKQGYTDASIQSYWTRVRQGILQGNLMAILGDERTPAATVNSARYALERWVDFRESENTPEGSEEAKLLRNAIDSWARNRKKKRRRGGHGREEKIVRVGISTDHWRRLRTQVDQDDSPEGLFLQILLRCGLRVGDILRIPRDAVVEGLRTGEMQLKLKGNKIYPYPATPFTTQFEKLMLIGDEWEIMQDLVGGSYYTAVKRIHALLKVNAAELGITDNVYPHRIRHTVITEFADRYGIKVAQQIAGHESSRTTERYTRRPRPTNVIGAAMNELLEE